MATGTYELWQKLQNGERIEMTRQVALSFIDETQRLGLPLNSFALDTLSTALQEGTPAGFTTTIENYGNQYRITVKRKGFQLPWESGDNSD